MWRRDPGIILSAPFQLLGVCSHAVSFRRAKGNRCMKRPRALYDFLWIVGIMVLLCGCTGASEPQAWTPTTSKASPSAPATQLKPEGALPSTCPATPVYQG